jgi:hypothetical protein
MYVRMFVCLFLCARVPGILGRKRSASDLELSGDAAGLRAAAKRGRGGSSNGHISGMGMGGGGASGSGSGGDLPAVPVHAFPGAIGASPGGRAGSSTPTNKKR